MSETSQMLPRLWVPGVCILEGRALRVGPGVGWQRARGIADWKGGAVAFEKSQSPHPPPESRIDPERYPRLHAVAKQCPITASAIEDDEQHEQHESASPRHLVILWHRVSGGGIIEMRGGGEPRVGFEGELPGRFRILSERFTEQDYEDRYCDFGVHSDITIDRVIRAVSDGRFDQAWVELAVDLDEASRSKAMMQAWETWLTAVDERAREQGDTARQVVAVLEQSQDETLDEVELPLYGTVEAQSLFETLMARDDQSDPGPDAIRIPAEKAFFVPPHQRVELEWPPAMALPAVSTPVRSAGGLRLYALIIVLAIVAALLALLP